MVPACEERGGSWGGQGCPGGARMLGLWEGGEMLTVQCLYKSGKAFAGAISKADWDDRRNQLAVETGRFLLVFGRALDFALGLAPWTQFT